MHAMDEYWTFDVYPILRLTIRDFVGIDINNGKYCYEIKQSHWCFELSFKLSAFNYIKKETLKYFL